MTRTGFELRPLPVPFRIPDALGFDAPVLEPERLLAAASRRAGLPAEFPAHVGEALERMCRSIRDTAKLHFLGRANMHSLIVTGLSELLRVEDEFRRRPELARTKLEPPIIVLGLPRSGTTFLHRLLSVPAAAEPLTLERHLFPSSRRLDPLASRVEAELIFWPWKYASKTYGLDAIHYVRPALPDECNFGMRLTMRSMIFWSMAPAYDYLDWLLDQDLRETYQLYRRLLLLHQSRAPNKRLVLKCPHHLAWLPALREALPEAHLVQTHRDPLQTVPSECKLVLSLQGLATHELDWRRTVAANREKVRCFAERSLAFADSEAGRDVVHVDYRRLRDEPVPLVRELHTRLGLELDDPDLAALDAFFADNRQHKHGKNHYSLEQFELDADEINADFAGYRARFLSGESAERGSRPMGLGEQP